MYNDGERRKITFDATTAPPRLAPILSPAGYTSQSRRSAQYTTVLLALNVAQMLAPRETKAVDPGQAARSPLSSRGFSCSCSCSLACPVHQVNPTTAAAIRHYLLGTATSATSSTAHPRSAVR